MLCLQAINFQTTSADHFLINVNDWTGDVDVFVDLSFPFAFRRLEELQSSNGAKVSNRDWERNQRDWVPRSKLFARYTISTEKGKGKNYVGHSVPIVNIWFQLNNRIFLYQILYLITVYLGGFNIWKHCEGSNPWDATRHRIQIKPVSVKTNSGQMHLSAVIFNWKEL